MKRRWAYGLLGLMVGILAAVCGVWLRVQRQQYERNRQLIVALVHGDDRQALALVNEGADPNTRYAPPPAPTFKLLLDQLLHHSTPPVSDTPTAFQIACGAYWEMDGVAVSKENLFPDSPQLVQVMLKHGANVDAEGPGKQRALEDAALLKRTGTAILLVEWGANVNALDDAGITPLMAAAGRNQVALAVLLLAHGARPNVQDMGGNTALHYAVMDDAEASVVRVLLAHGADPHLINTEEDTPLMIALRRKHPDVVALLKRVGK